MLAHLFIEGFVIECSSLNIPTISKLIEKVIHEEGVFEQLLNDFSINVTEMFRNPAFFKALREHVIPEYEKAT